MTPSERINELEAEIRRISEQNHKLQMQLAGFPHLVREARTEITSLRKAVADKNWSSVDWAIQGLEQCLPIV